MLVLDNVYTLYTQCCAEVMFHILVVTRAIVHCVMCMHDPPGPAAPEGKSIHI